MRFLLLYPILVLLAVACLIAAVLAIVFLSVLPMVWEWFRHRSASRTAVEETAEVVDDVRKDRI